MMVGDTFKAGHCIKCPSNVFRKPGTVNNDDGDHQKFYDDCLVNAFNTSTSEVKKDYQCDPAGDDYAKAKAFIAAY